MKKVSLLAAAAALLVASGSASADWFGDRWGNGYNDWPVWTPMYWMEEMADTVDDNGWGGRNNHYNGPYGGYGAPVPYYGYGAPVAPYGYGAPAAPVAPYGYPAPMAPYGYGAPAVPAK